MPFRIAKDILEQCAVPQLMVLEEASPVSRIALFLCSVPKSS